VTRRAIVIGAGPYGLAATAHLRSAGVSTHCFGEPLAFWRERMPAGMVLRSTRRSTSVAAPARKLSVGDYEHATGRRLGTPSLLRDEFIDYGLWFQQQAVCDLDRREVTGVVRDRRGFAVDLADGGSMCADVVVVAAGVLPFPRLPSVFASLDPAIVSHTSQHGDLRALAGRRVGVIGAGQSALESAVLLSAYGAEVEVLARSSAIRWLGEGGSHGAVARMLRKRLPRPLPPTDVGGVSTGWIAAVPDVFRRAPGPVREWVSDRCTRPAAAHWVRPRLGPVRVSCGKPVIRASEAGGGVRLHLADGSERTFDHILLGTGYEIDVRRYPFLDRDLLAERALSNGYPVLRPGLESSVPGLHFLGAPAAHSFGPVMRFVVGTWYAGPALTRAVLGRSQTPLRFSF
jgi:FAD-dependent urate hydroxylase